MVNAVADHSCVYNSATGILTLGSLGTINFSALVEELNEELKSTNSLPNANAGQPIILRPGQLRSGGIASEFPSVFDQRQAEQNMALGRVVWDKIIKQMQAV